MVIHYRYGVVGDVIIECNIGDDLSELSRFFTDGGSRCNTRKLIALISPHVGCTSYVNVTKDYNNLRPFAERAFIFLLLPRHQTDGAVQDLPDNFLK